MNKSSTLSREWLADELARMIEDDVEIDPSDNLVLYGLDSIAVMTFASDLKQMGIDVGFEELATTPTMDAWWALIQSRLAA